MASGQWKEKIEFTLYSLFGQKIVCHSVFVRSMLSPVRRRTKLQTLRRLRYPVTSMAGHSVPRCSAAIGSAHLIDGSAERYRCYNLKIIELSIFYYIDHFPGFWLVTRRASFTPSLMLIWIELRVTKLRFWWNLKSQPSSQRSNWRESHCQRIRIGVLSKLFIEFHSKILN